MIKLSINSTFDEVAMSLQHTLSEIKKVGENKHLEYDKLMKYGRLMLMENSFDKAYQIFQQCSIHATDNGIQNIKELYYWTSRCQEGNGNKVMAINSYLMLLENFADDDNFINKYIR